MFRKIVCVVFSFLLFTAVSALNPQQIAGNQLSKENFAGSLNKFSYNFVRHMGNDEKNIITSPLSVAMCLGMLLKGAKGQTLAQLKQVTELATVTNDNQIQLRMKETLDEYRKMDGGNGVRPATVGISNLLLASESANINSDYKSFVVNNYDALIEEVNFVTKGEEIKERVNSFVNNKTRGEIKTMLQKPLPPNTVLYLLNTIYFKGSWVKGFNANNTLKRKFYNKNGSEKDVNTMVESKNAYRYYVDSSKEVTIVELEYFGNLSMILLLPKARFGLPQVLANLTNEQLENMIVEMRKIDAGKVTLRLPKFRTEMKIDAKEVLQNMGLVVPFSGGADFSGIDSSIQLSSAVQKAVIEIDETGTVAAAVTGIGGISRGGAFHPSTELDFDHPFAFIIRDDITKLNLFYGDVNNL